MEEKNPIDKAMDAVADPVIQFAQHYILPFALLIALAVILRFVYKRFF